jgi:dephospho-CoA kinase
MGRDGFTEEEARARLRSQPPIKPKLKLVDEVLDNSGSMSRTRAQVKAAWGRFRVKDSEQEPGDDEVPLLF